MAKVELKAPVVAEISEAIKDAQSVVLVDYRGLTVEQDTALRKQLREAGINYKVYKNTCLLYTSMLSSRSVVLLCFLTEPVKPLRFWYSPKEIK